MAWRCWVRRCSRRCGSTINPLNLRSQQSESVAALLDMMQDPHTTPNIIEILTPSLADADKLAARLRALPLVEGVTSLSDFVPEDQTPSSRRLPTRGACSDRASTPAIR